MGSTRTCLFLNVQPVRHAPVGPETPRFLFQGLVLHVFLLQALAHGGRVVVVRTGSWAKVLFPTIINYK